VFVEVLEIGRVMFEEAYALERILYGGLLELKTRLEREGPCSRASLQKCQLSYQAKEMDRHVR
jgi:hypothetical protein